MSRFKGLGEMLPQQLKETTMDRSVRTLLRVEIVEDERDRTGKVVDQFMGNKPEAASASSRSAPNSPRPDELDI